MSVLKDPALLCALRTELSSKTGVSSCSVSSEAKLPKPTVWRFDGWRGMVVTLNKKRGKALLFPFSLVPSFSLYLFHIPVIKSFMYTSSIYKLQIPHGSVKVTNCYFFSFFLSFVLSYGADKVKLTSCSYPSIKYSILAIGRLSI